MIWIAIVLMLWMVGMSAVIVGLMLRCNDMERALRRANQQIGALTDKVFPPQISCVTSSPEMDISCISIQTASCIVEEALSVQDESLDSVGDMSVIFGAPLCSDVPDNDRLKRERDRRLGWVPQSGKEVESSVERTLRLGTIPVFGVGEWTVPREEIVMTD